MKMAFKRFLDEARDDPQRSCYQATYIPLSIVHLSKNQNVFPPINSDLNDTAFHYEV